MAAGHLPRGARPRARRRPDGAIVPDPEGIITGGHDNETARTVAVYENEKLNAPVLKAMFEQVIANNRAGGWRKLKAEGGS